ncbi:hypothetical protein MLD38_031157 [Melastoma candidum]|uniref:Uncharacterized protein n=1 Tax=Melastoma candidum TaxID=119954 RepID=A0ACB9MTR3_9MYRT|nr:hypothetical protein MLD38_031157 [Melastoma candidum]
MGMELEEKHQQSAAPPTPHLPKELWSVIGGHLDSHIDLLRFRSVCSSWRSLPIPRNSRQPEFPLVVPSFTYPMTSVSLVRFIVYRLEPSDEGGSPQGWLIKVDESHPGSPRLISTVSQRPIKYKPANFPQTVKFNEFRVSEVCREYVIGRNSSKVVFLRDYLRHGLRNCVAFALTREGSLRYWRYGDDHWKAPVWEGTSMEVAYDDLSIRDRQVYAVDRFGTVHWIDSCHRAVQFSPPLCGVGQKKHLLEYLGDLYVVDRYEQDYNCQESQHPRLCCYRTIDFKLYRLDQEWGKWDEINELRGMVMFIGESSSFCISMDGFSRCGENRIYFTEKGRCGLFEGKVYVFDLVDRSVKRLVSMPECWRTLWPVF